MGGKEGASKGTAPLSPVFSPAKSIFESGVSAAEILPNTSGLRTRRSLPTANGSLKS